MKNETKQTAVEWFAEKIRNYKTPLNMAELEFILIHNDMINRFEQQAKEMEKKQHKKTWLDSTSQFDNAAEMTFKKDFDEHYNKTYGGGEQ